MKNVILLGGEGSELLYSLRKVLRGCRVTAQSGSVRLQSGVLLVKEPCAEQAEVELGEKAIAVFLSSSAHAAELSSRAMRAVCCGTSARDTLALASLTSDCAMFSLRRTIPTLYGELEPQEVRLRLKKERSIDDLLLLTAALLVSGRRQPREGFIV